jgi:hypothetical protein
MSNLNTVAIRFLVLGSASGGAAAAGIATYGGGKRLRKPSKIMA